MSATDVADEAAAGGNGGGRKKLILMGGGGLVVLALLGGGAFFFLKGHGEPAPGETAVHEAAAGPTALYFDLPELVVNLVSTDQHPSFVKLTISLEVPDKATIDQITPNMPRVMDLFQTYLHELRASDLQGSAGLFRMKAELQRRLNIAVAPAKVTDVLFRSVLVQ